MANTETAIVPASSKLDLQQVNSILDTVPDLDDDPTPRMAAAILAAADPLDWNSVFESKSIKKSARQLVRFESIRKAPSSFQGGIPYYLVADVTYLETGETGVMSVSSMMAVIQLLAAHVNGWLPVECEVVQKDKATKNGFYPIHLRALTPKEISRKAS